MEKSKDYKQIENELKNLNTTIEPVDSWQDLRKRIDDKLDSADATKSKMSFFLRHKSIISAAAVFLFVSGIVYYIGYDTGRNHQNQSLSRNLLSKQDIQNMSLAFQQVQELFKGQAGWLMIGSNNDVQMGINNENLDNKNAAIIRLAIRIDSNQEQYLDLVTYVNQKNDMSLPLLKGQSLKISLTATFNQKGEIAIEISNLKGQSSNAVAVNLCNNNYTKLLSTHADGMKIDILGIGKTVPNI